MYGVRGANGVVLVTTKRGKQEKLSFTARANATISWLKRLPEYCDGYNYAKLANEALVVRGDDPKYTNQELDIITAWIRIYIRMSIGRMKFSKGLIGNKPII